MKRVVIGKTPMYLTYLRHWPVLLMVVSAMLAIAGCGNGHSGHSH